MTYLDLSLLTPSDWVLAGTTLIGPLLAVQVQKWLEGIRLHGQRKEHVFRMLMTTRGSRLSLQHVEALNMIDVTFYGRRIFGLRFQSSGERRVIEKWHEYLDSLGDRSNTEATYRQRDDRFLDLLGAMGDNLGFAFNRVNLKNNAYSPIGHNTLEQEQQDLRAAALEVFSGRRPLTMSITSFPPGFDGTAAEPPQPSR